uniref:Dermacentor 9 kDa family member n=1 Tax=Rhipicephalus zambeziensis TaxID=60191 RepID=A0A224YDH8_9ACAR
MNGKCVAFCSVLVLALLIERISSTNLLCYGGTHLCYQLNQENCTCVARGSKCPPDGLELKYLSGRPQSCNAVYNGRSVTGCRCICA